MFSRRDFGNTVAEVRKRYQFVKDSLA